MYYAVCMLVHVAMHVSARLLTLCWNVLVMQTMCVCELAASPLLLRQADVMLG